MLASDDFNQILHGRYDANFVTIHDRYAVKAVYAREQVLKADRAITKETQKQ